MSIRNIGIFSFMVLGALALAQEANREGMVAHGRGALGSADKRMATFQFEVHKFKGREGRVVVNGNSRFRQAPNQHGKLVEIGIRNVDEAVFDGNTVRFAGNAVLETIVEGKPRRLEGRAQVMGKDQRKPNENANNDKRDLYRIHFKAKQGNVEFVFEGAVREGDIVVKKNDGGGGGGNTGAVGN